MIVDRMTRGNVLATIKELRKVKRPCARVVPVSVQAFVPESRKSKTTDRLSVISHRRSILLGGIKNPPSFSENDKFLLERLTTLHDFRRPYDGEQHGELFIHWFYRDRTVDRLSRCEIFHLNMLQYFNVLDRVEVIHIRCAARNGMTGAMKKAFEILSGGKAKVDFKIVPQKGSWEYDTFKECCEYAVDTGKFVYYTHFKGVSRIKESALGLGNKYVKNSTDLDILYWCYLMYLGMFTAPSGVKAIGPIRTSNHRRLKVYVDNRWTRNVRDKQDFFYRGSFQAFSGKVLKENLQELGVSLNKALPVGTHTVELFLSAIFKESEIYSLPFTKKSMGTPGYHEWTKRVFPQIRYLFSSVYTCNVLPTYKQEFDTLYRDTSDSHNNICVANGTYKWIGGTDTFNWAMCKALIDMGYTVYYYAPDMDGTGITEKHLQEIGVRPYTEGIPLIACFANQQSGLYFVGKCPVVQTCHSAFTMLEYPIKGALAYISISEEIQLYLKVRGFQTDIIRNGIDLNRYCSKRPLNTTPKVLSICQGDDTLLKDACAKLGWRFINVPKEVGSRIWHIEDLINDADIVVGIGRSLYDAMACGRACISWDNRKLNPFNGCGYVTADNWYACAKTNFTGRGFPQIHTVDGLVAELNKYNPEDGKVMRSFAEKELNAHKNVKKYLGVLGIQC